MRPSYKPGKTTGPPLVKPNSLRTNGRNAARLGDGAAVEEVARVEGGVADELEDAAVQVVGAGLGDDVGEARRAVADFGGHHAGTGFDLLNRIDVEVGERGAAHFGVGGVDAVHGEHGGGAALSVDGELLGEIGGSVGVGLRAGGEQEQLAEIALVERQGSHLAAGEFRASGRFRGGAGPGLNVCRRFLSLRWF